MTDVSIPWGPTGEAVYERTYSRVKADGERETWPETVQRVVRGNLALVYGEDMDEWTPEVASEYIGLIQNMVAFKILPAGRHLWASGVKGRQYLFNCHVAGYESLEAHFDFTLLRLAEGGGVGANYSTKYLKGLGAPRSEVEAHIVCDESHPDYADLQGAGVLSSDYDSDWPGAFEVEDTREGWSAAVQALVSAALSDETKHRERVFDVSRVRGKGSRLKTMGGTASGPLPLALALRKIGHVLTGAHYRIVDDGPILYRRQGRGIYDGPDWNKAHLNPLEVMLIDHYIAEAIVAGGTRRSARMAIVKWNDPQVFDFINCKSDTGEHWSTNISVEIDDEFIRLIDEPRLPNGLNANGAQDVLDAVVKGMLTNGEPGLWNGSLSNKGEPNPVIATNPCGEIALEAWENCNLGHVNMDAFVNHDGSIDHDGMAKAHRLMTRFLIRATYGDVTDDKQAATLARNRRIGVGHFGTQGFLAKRGVRFSEARHDTGLRFVLMNMAAIVDKAAREYAHDLRIPVPVKTRTVAPTGTIAKMPGRTEGIHPIYARRFIRRVRYSTSDPAQAKALERFKAEGYPVEPDRYAASTDVVSFLTEDQLVSEVRDMGLDPAIVESADEISLENMLEMQRIYQRYWADNAVSFTVNVEAEPHQRSMMANGYDCPTPTGERVTEVRRVLSGFLADLKGTTLMVDGARPQAPYERLTDEQFDMLNHGQHVHTDAGYDEECASGACPIK